MMDEEKRFTQEEVDEIIKERLRRERKKFEKEVTEATVDIPDYKADYLNIMKQVKLIDAGLTPDQAERYTKYIDAETEEEVTAQAGVLVGDVSRKGKTYTDPSSGKKPWVWSPFSK